MREERTDLGAALAMRGELPLGFFGEHLEVPFTALKFFHLDGLSGVSKELRFGVPRINVRNPSAHVEKYDALGLWSVMRRFWGQRINRAGACAVLRQQLPNDARPEQRPAHHRTKEATTVEI